MYHHICNSLQFPPEEALQVALESYPALSGLGVQKSKLLQIFAKTLANQPRSPAGIEFNVHSLIDDHKEEIPWEHRENIFRVFTQALIEIATEYTNKHTPFR